MQLLVKNIDFLEANSISQIKSSTHIRKDRGIKKQKNPTKTKKGNEMKFT